MKKILTVLATLALTFGLTAPAFAIETTSRASLYNSAYSEASVQYQTANGGGYAYSLRPGTKFYATYSNPVTRIRVWCRATLTGGYVTAHLTPGVWYSWTYSSGAPSSGTGTVRVDC